MRKREQLRHHERNTGILCRYRYLIFERQKKIFFRSIYKLYTRERINSHAHSHYYFPESYFLKQPQFVLIKHRNVVSEITKAGGKIVRRALS